MAEFTGSPVQPFARVGVALVAVLAWRRFGRLLIGVVTLGVIAGVLYMVIDEAQTSRRQASRLAKLVRDARYQLEPGASPSPYFAGSGPYDERLGYEALPKFIERLASQG